MDEPKGTKKQSTEEEQIESSEKPTTNEEIYKGDSVSVLSSTIASKPESTIELGSTIAIDREEYLQAHRDLTFDKHQLQMKNNILHKRLAEYYRKRKQEHVLKPIAKAADLEEKYQQKLYAYEELKGKDSKEIAEIAEKLNEVEDQYKSRQQIAANAFDALQNLERATGRGLVFSQTGKPIPDKAVDRLLSLQRQKFDDMSALRLRYIRTKNAVTEIENFLRKLECLGPGLYVTYYEKLSIDHENYVAKIEEREDELIKNRVRCTERNQMLAHIREKMHHTEELIDLRECDLGDVEIDNYRAREELAKVKRRRDKLRYDLIEERQKAGLLTRQDLLHDFQESLDQVIELRKIKENLEIKISKATEQLQSIRHREYRQD